MMNLKKVPAAVRTAVCVAAGCVGILTLLMGTGSDTSLAAGKTTDQRVFDYADLYTEEEEARLQQQAQYFEKQEEMTMVILTMDVAGDVGLAAENFYYDAGYSFGYDGSDVGVVFAINMNEANRAFYIYWSEGAEKYFSDAELEEMLDDVEYYMVDHRFVEAGEEFFVTVSNHNDMETRVLGVNLLSMFWFAIISLGITVFVTLPVVGMQKSKVTTGGKDYQKGKIQVNARSDVLVNTTRRVIHHSDSSSGGGGGTFHSSHSRGGGGGRSF